MTNSISLRPFASQTRTPLFGANNEENHDTIRNTHREDVHRRNEEINENRELAEDIFNESNTRSQEDFSRLDDEKLESHEKLNILDKLHTFYKTNIRKMETHFAKLQGHLQDNELIKSKEQKAIEKSEAKIRLFQRSKVTDFIDDEKMREYADARILSRRNSINRHNEIIDMRNKLDENHKEFEKTLHQRIQKLKNAANSTKERITAVDQLGVYENADADMKSQDEVLNTTWTNADPELNNMSSLLARMNVTSTQSNAERMNDFLRRHRNA